MKCNTDTQFFNVNPLPQDKPAPSPASFDSSKIVNMKKVCVLNKPNAELTDFSPGIYEVEFVVDVETKLPEQFMAGVVSTVKTKVGFKKILWYELQILEHKIPGKMIIRGIFEISHNFLISGSLLALSALGVVGVGVTGWTLTKAEKFTEKATKFSWVTGITIIGVLFAIGVLKK